MKGTTGKHAWPAVGWVTIMLAGCATSPGPVTPYDPGQPAALQAAGFISTQREKQMQDVRKVGITACNVMFATSASAHAGTSAGLFATADGSRRGEARVSTIFSLNGLSESDMQQLANQSCAHAEEKLAAAGYQVIPHSTLKADEAFQRLQQSGRRSPFEYSSGDARYLVFTRTGDSIFDERYIGTASGLGQAFRAAAGGAAWQHEAVVLENQGMTGINLNILIDFAQMSSDGNQGRLGGLASKNRAETSGEVRLSATGSMTVKPHAALKCWNRFGKHECMVGGNQQPLFQTVRSVSLETPFYTSVENVTTTADRVSAGVTAALSMLGGTSRSTDRYQVNVSPQGYGAVQTQTTDALLDMIIHRMTDSH